MHKTVASFERRRRQWKSEGTRTLALAVTVAGIGWTVVVPAVLGFLLGRWLDGRFGTGIVISAGLGLAGLTLGCYAAWSRLARQ
jgi:ATP synthase protein I